jgi:hypothetical protein
VNLSEVVPVAIKSPTLIADDDPYDSIKPTVIPDATPQPATETAETQKSNSGASANVVKSTSNTAGVNPASPTTPSAPEIRKAVPIEQIRKAIPVQPQDRQPGEIRRAVPVKPLDQEDAAGTLLRSAAQPPGDDVHD